MLGVVFPFLFTMLAKRGKSNSEERIDLITRYIDLFGKNTIMAEYRRNSHSTSSLSCHLVWATKYRYHVLKGDLQKRCRDLLIPICDSENVHILKEEVSKDHVHMHVEYPLFLSISVLVNKLKGRSSRLLQ